MNKSFHDHLDDQTNDCLGSAVLEQYISNPDVSKTLAFNPMGLYPMVLTVANTCNESQMVKNIEVPGVYASLQVMNTLDSISMPYTIDCRLLDAKSGLTKRNENQEIDLCSFLTLIQANREFYDSSSSSAPSLLVRADQLQVDQLIQKLSDGHLPLFKTATLIVAFTDEQIKELCSGMDSPLAGLCKSLHGLLMARYRVGFLFSDTAHFQNALSYEEPLLAALPGGSLGCANDFVVSQTLDLQRFWNRNDGFDVTSFDWIGFKNAIKNSVEVMDDVLDHVVADSLFEQASATCKRKLAIGLRGLTTRQQSGNSQAVRREELRFCLKNVLMALEQGAVQMSSSLAQTKGSFEWLDPARFASAYRGCAESLERINRYGIRNSTLIRIDYQELFSLVDEAFDPYFYRENLELLALINEHSDCGIDHSLSVPMDLFDSEIAELVVRAWNLRLPTLFIQATR